MSPIRTLIVDDEPLARELLRSMLEEDPEIEILAECGNGREALEAVLEHEPDLVFLDVQMPEMNGFELLGELGRERMPEVIFVTAYDQYALRAFDVHALDYLLKPFDDERLAQSLERAKRHLRQAAPVQPDRIMELLRDMDRRERYRDRIPIRDGVRTILQPVAEVEWFESDGKYVKVHVGEREHVIRESMIQLEEILDPRTFLRVSRGSIVNVDHIREVQSWFHGDYAIILKSGAQVNTTRSYRDSLKRILARE